MRLLSRLGSPWLLAVLCAATAATSAPSSAQPTLSAATLPTPPAGPQAARALAQDGLVRAVNRFRPEWKVNPGVATSGNSDLVAATSPGAEEAVATAVRALGGEVRQAGEGTVVARLDPAQATALARSEDVLYVDTKLPLQLVNARARAMVRAEGAGTPWAAGLTGSGQVIGVADTGLDTGNATTLHPDLRDRLQVTPLTLSNPGDWSDRHGHGTHVAGSILRRRRR